MAQALTYIDSEKKEKRRTERKKKEGRQERRKDEKKERGRKEGRKQRSHICTIRKYGQIKSYNFGVQKC